MRDFTVPMNPLQSDYTLKEVPEQHQLLHSRPAIMSEGEAETIITSSSNNSTDKETTNVELPISALLDQL